MRQATSPEATRVGLHYMPGIPGLYALMIELKPCAAGELPMRHAFTIDGPTARVLAHEITKRLDQQRSIG